MFNSWCSSQGFTNSTNISHVRMDGGVLSVPFDRLNQFNEKYIEAIRSGEKLFIVEQKSPRYNFFVDIDYKDTTSLDMDEIKSVCKIICDKVKRHGGKDCLISVSPPKKVGSLIKTGVHLNWSGFVVDQSSAVALREHILVALSKAKSHLDWNEIIDSSVYGNIERKTGGSGFRMIWSHKMSKCDVCRGKGCETCKGHGKNIQLAYLPIFIYRSGPLSGILQVNQKPDLDILKMSIVRTDEPQNVNISSPSNSVKERNFTEEDEREEVCDGEIRLLIEKYIRDNMEGQKNAYVIKIFKKKETYLVKTNSRYCENLRGEHSSNHVWFLISGTIIAQKCFCNCPTIRGRRDGFCKDFFGRKHLLSPTIISRLYPKPQELKKCPEIKKFVESKVKIVDVKVDLQNYIQNNMKTCGTISVLNMKKEKTNYLITTNSGFCEKIGGEHNNETVMSYVVKKRKFISQACPICKDPKGVRTHVLNGFIINNLFPKGA